MSNDPYGDILRRTDPSSGALTMAATATAGVNPDERARALARAKRLGYPAAVAQLAPEQVAREAEIADIDDATRDTPVVRRRFGTLDFAALAKDEPSALANFERGVREFLTGQTRPKTKEQALIAMSGEEFGQRVQGMQQRYNLDGDTARSLAAQGVTFTGPNDSFIGPWQRPKASLSAVAKGIYSGVVNTARGAIAGFQMSGAARDGNAVAEAAAAQRGLRADIAQEMGTPEFDTWAGEMLYGGAQGTAQFLPLLGAGVATGGAAVPMAGFYALTAGNAYRKYRERGGTHNEAALGSTLEGLSEVATELIPFGHMMKSLGRAKGVEFFTGLLGKEVAGENVNLIVSKIVDTAIANPDKTWSDALAELPREMLDTTAMTLVQTGLLAGMSHGLSRTMMRKQATDYEISRAIVAEQQLKRIVAMAGQSKLRERDPQTFADLAQEIAQSQPDAPRDVRFDARTLLEVATPEELKQLPSVQAQLTQGVAPGEEVTIPIGELLSGVAGTPLEKKLLEHARVGDSDLSQYEAKAAQQQAEALLQQDFEQAMQEATNSSDVQRSAEAVKKILLDQLVAANRHTKDASDAMATMAAQMFTVLGHRLGMTAEQVYAKYPLKIVNNRSGQNEDAFSKQNPYAITVEGYHYSKEARPMLDTRAFGTGLKGSGREQYQNATDARRRSRSYFYVDKGTGITPEAGVGGVAHRTQLTNIYDSNSDPLRLRRGDQASFETAVLDAGFSGYLDRMGGDQPGQVVMLGDQQIPVEQLGPMGKTKGQVVPPATKRPAVGRDIVVDALRENTALPAGSLTPQRWSEVLKAALPAEQFAQLEATGVFAPGESMYKSELINKFEAATEAPVYAQALGARVPTGKKSSEDPVSNPSLIATLAEVFKVPVFGAKLATHFDGIVSLKRRRMKDPEARLEAYVEQLVDNLLWLHDQVPAEIRNRSKLWYDGARTIVDRWAARYKVYSDMQLAGVAAVMSPQMDWFQNVTLAERILDVWTYKQGEAWSDAMTQAARGTAIDSFDNVERLTGKKLNELETDLDRALWVAAYDLANHPRELNIVTPEGGFMGPVLNLNGKPMRGSWANGFAPVAKAVSILRDGSVQNVSDSLGEKHKVRSFYNNIFNPADPVGHVTSDTHAVAAALLLPLSGASPEAAFNFGGASNRDQGLNGSYPIYVEAYRRAAERRGLLPREMQSITWEAVRGLFNPQFKAKFAKDKAFKASFEKLWSDYHAGDTTIEAAREQLLALSGGITSPDWVGSSGPVVDGTEAASYARELHQGERADGAPGRGAGVDAAGVSDQTPGRLARLPGAPSVPGFDGPDPRLVAVAEAYARANGFELRRQREYVQVDPERATRIAAAYEAMSHAPQDPAVAEAYANLIRQTRAQYDALEAAGYKFWFMDMQREDNQAYAASPWNAMRDIRANQRMGVFPTVDGFGSSELDVSNNPLLADTGLRWPSGALDGELRPVLANDLFRAVHDAFGHGLEGAGFRAQGEENAWQAHSRLFTGSAVGAITSETRGQNSWLNYGPHGEANRNAKVEDTVFADQKTGLMPEWTWYEGRVDDMPPQFDAKTERELQALEQIVSRSLVDDVRRVLAEYGERPEVVSLLTAEQRAEADAVVVPLLERAGEAHGELSDALKAIARQVGLQARIPGIKGLDRAGTELVLEYPRLADGSLDPNALQDLVRGTIVVADQAGVEAAAAMVRERFEVLREKDKFTSPTPSGYRDYLLNVRMPNGAIAEIQINIPAMIVAKSVNHKLYNLEREMPEGVSGKLRLQSFQRSIYSEAFAAPREAAQRAMSFASAGVALASNGLEGNARVGSSANTSEPSASLSTGAPSTSNSLASDGTSNMGTSSDGSILAQAETPAFKRWFGDSKVVDEQGRPLVVYRGTDNPDRVVGGSWWTENPQAAAEYGRAIVPAYLRLENPARDDNLVDLLREYEGSPGYTDLARYDDGELYPARDLAVLDDGFRAFVESRGFDGLLVYDDSHSFSSAGVSYVPFSAEQIKSAVGNNGNFDPNDSNILHQAKDPRGTFNPSTVTIALLERADLSTFHHEMAHFYLEVLTDVASQPGAPADIVGDMDVLLKWFGVKDLDAWRKMSLNERRANHEKFAEHYELYLFEGKAPSNELRDLFRRFSAWMKNVYKSIQAFMLSRGSSLTPEVRRVYDHMLATEAQIRESEEADRFEPLFKAAAEAGMDPRQWAEYQRLMSEAHDTAIEDLQKRGLADMRWLTRAITAARKAVDKAVSAAQKTVHDEVGAEVNAMPVYAAQRALEGLRKPSDADKDALKDWRDRREAALERATEKHKAELMASPEAEGLVGIQKGQFIAKNKKMLANSAERDVLLWERDNPKPTRTHDPADLQVAADRFGFSSVPDMLREMMEAQPANVVIEGMTDQRMLERHGDLATEDGAKRATLEAVHNEARARFLATELSALTKARSPIAQTIKAAKLFAAEMIGRKRVRDLYPDRHEKAAARAAAAADKARKAGDNEMTISSKQEQLMHFHLARAASDAKLEAQKIVDRLNRISESKTIAQDYKDQIDKLLERVELRPRTLRDLDRRASLNEWLERQAADGLEPDVPAHLLDDAQLTNWREMTMQELRGLHDTVLQIEHLGKLKKKLLASKDKREFQAIVDELIAGIEKHADARNRKGVTRTATTPGGRALEKLRMFTAAHVKTGMLARELDGGEDGGPVWEHLIRVANERADWETTRRAQATKDLTKILRPWLAKGKLSTPAAFPTIKRSLTRQEILAIALNTGNASNLQRLLGGEGWTLSQVEPVLDSLTKDDWTVVQAVWDYFETFRPEIGAKQKRIYGVEPKWVDPGSPVTEKYGLRGGYYPIKYDSRANQKAEAFDRAEEAKRLLNAAHNAATTRRSFTKARSEKVEGRPLVYDLRGLYTGIDDVIHDLAWHEWLIDSNRLLRAIDDTLRDRYGADAVNQFQTWRVSIAEGDTKAQHAIDSGVGLARQFVSISGLGYNVMSAAIQPLGISNSWARVGTRWLGPAVGRYIAHPIDATREAEAKSEFMANRARTRFRDLNELRNRVQGEQGLIANTRDNAFWLMQQMQRTVDVPTWHAGYAKALAEGNSEERAVDLADQAVIDAQGSGLTKDLAAIERGGALPKLFTAFYSFMNTSYNLLRLSGRVDNIGNVLATIVLVGITPAILTGLLRNALTPGDSGEDEDWEKLARKMAADQVSYLMGMVVGVREFTEAAKTMLHLADQQHDYSGPTGLRAINDVYRFVQQAHQGEFDDAFRKSAVNLVGDVTGLPSAQINRSITGFNALNEGETENPLALLFGYQEPK